MHLFYCDETNLDPQQGEFFVYGGVIIPSDVAPSLHDELELIRRKAGFRAKDVFKFNPKPGHISYDSFIQAKQDSIEVAAKYGCLLIVSVILHAIGRDIKEVRRNEINRVLFHFDCYLSRQESSGLVLIDRFSDRQIDAHVREKFSTGLVNMPYSDTMRLDHIVGIHYSAIGQSHFASLVDVILGSLRYAINAHSGQGSTKGARALLSLLAPLFYRSCGSDLIDEISLNFSPKVIQVSKYRAAYQALKDFLAAEGVVAKQKITDVREY